MLSLPLAFILSQDQTLHCIFLYLQLDPESRSIPQKELRFALILIVLKSVLACTCFFHHFNHLSRSFRNGTAKVHTFSFLPNFFSKKIDFFSKKIQDLKQLRIIGAGLLQDMRDDHIPEKR